MPQILFEVCVISVVIGLVAKLLCDAIKSAAEISWTEFALGALIVVPLLGGVTAAIGWNTAVGAKTTYNEYWGGWEMSTVWEKVKCERDGRCVQEYNCDSYRCRPHSCNCDSKGKNCSTCWDTCYHDCPYCTEEWNFTVKTSVGDFVIRRGGFPDVPIPWRGSIPASVVQRAGTGIPQFWADAKARIDSGKPGPATKVNQYENLLLASDLTILKQYSGAIEKYKAQKLMPDPVKGVYDWYHADKVIFVGWQPDNPKNWQVALAYANGSFGNEMQGTIILVIVQGVENPDEYSQALRAYWQNRKVHGADSLAKNTMVVVVGTSDGKTVSWARAFTGMPLGNEVLLATVPTVFAEIPLTPQNVIGQVSGEFYQKTKTDGTVKTDVRGLHDGGVLEQLLWGLQNPATKFERVSMSASDPTDKGTGFLYLKGEITPDEDQVPWIIFWAVVFSCIYWVVAAFFIGARKGYYSYSGYYR